MEKPNDSLRELAKQLYAAEAALLDGSDNNGTSAVCDKLRLSLIRFAGADAFVALMRRSLALSRAEIPALESVTLDSSGCLEGLDLIPAEKGIDPGTLITANLLLLLVTFMGEPIMKRLVKDAWPDLPFSE